MAYFQFYCRSLTTRSSVMIQPEKNCSFQFYCRSFSRLQLLLALELRVFQFYCRSLKVVVLGLDPVPESFTPFNSIVDLFKALEKRAESLYRDIFQFYCRSLKTIQ